MILVLELIGTCAFALAGSFIAINKDLDLFGIIFCGAVTASGGGIIRDLILGKIPPVFFTNQIYFIFSLLTSLIVFMLAATSDFDETMHAHDKIINIFDAVGLGTFTLVGAHIALELSPDNMFLAVLMGMITGCGGGMLRDVLVSDIPVIFRENIYAVASIIGAILYCELLSLVEAQIAIGISFFVILLIRYLAYKFKLNLPKINRH